MDTLYCFRTDRMTSRFQAMLGCWRYTRKVGAQLSVIWPPPRDEYLASDNKHFELSRIFDVPEVYARHPDLHFADGPIPARFMKLWKKHAPQLHHGGVIDSFSELKMGDYHLNGAIRWYRDRTETREQATKEASALFKELPLRRELAQIIDAEAKEDFTALHIRRGDLVGIGRDVLLRLKVGQIDLARAAFRMLIAKSIPIKAYEAFLQDGKRNYLVFSDDTSVAQNLMDKFGSGNDQAYSYASEGLYSIERDFIEMSVMSRCREVVGGGSVFARFAAMIADKPMIDLRSSLHWDDYIDMLFNECLDPEKDAVFFNDEQEWRQKLQDMIRSDVKYRRRIGHMVGK